MNDDNDDATMTDVSDTFCDVAIPMMILPEESSDTFGDERDSEREAESSCATTTTTTTTTTTALASRPLLPSVSVPEVHGRGLRVMNHAGRILWKAAMGKQGLSAGVWAKLLQRTLGAMIFGSTTASASLSSSSSSGGNNSNNNNWLPSVWPAKAQSSQEEEEEAEDCWNEEDINCNYNYNDECEAMEESPAEISPLPEPEPLPSSDDRSTATKRNRWSTLLRWPGVVVSDEEEEEGGGDNDEPIDHRGYDGYKYHQDREVEDYRPRKRVRTGLSW